MCDGRDWKEMGGQVGMKWREMGGDRRKGREWTDMEWG